MKRVLLATVVCLFITMPTFGDMTYQRWDFLTDPLPGINVLPEVDLNPFGQPSMDILGADSYLPVVKNVGGGGAGTASGMVMTIPNSRATDGWKWVEVTIGYSDWTYDLTPPQWSWTLDTTPATTAISSGSLGTSFYSAGGFPCEEWTWRFEVAPNPQLETVIIDMSGTSWFVDYVEVTTECVPVPGAVLLGLLGLSVAGVKLRRFA